MKPWCLVLVVACLGASACHGRDLSPEETVKAYEDYVTHGDAGGAKALLTAERAKEASELFLAVRAEEHNREREGVVSEHRLTETTGATPRVISVYVMKDRLRRTYTWELVREGGRWRIGSWDVEVAGGPR